jgi:hypothetical protein
MPSPRDWLAAPASWFLLAYFGSSAPADDLSHLGDEFGEASTFAAWQDLGVVEGWVTPSYEAADIDTTAPGHFHIVPGALTWYNHLRGLLFFKEVSGDFVATVRVRVLSRHDPVDPNEPPNRSFSLAGVFAHGPRPVVQAAPQPYTTDAVWPPGDFGSDYLPGTENYIFLSYGSAGDPGVRQFEIKATRHSSSRLYYSANGIDQGQTDAWLQMVRVGDTVVCLRKHAVDGPWFAENRYPNPDHPFPDFGETIQLGVTAYTDWPTAAPFSDGGLQTSYHFNYAPPGGGQPDLVAQVDYFRVRRPDPLLTEAALQAVAVSYDPATDTTASPPVPLSASPAAAPYLGDPVDLPHDPYRDWAALWFGDPGAADAAPGADPDRDGLDNTGEFALGGGPLDASSTPLPVAAAVGGVVTLDFTPAAGTGVGIEAQASADLSTWSPAASLPAAGGPWQTHIDGASATTDTETGEVSVAAPPPATSARWFLRLRFSVP